MQIVIDIPEENYNFIKKQVAAGITNPLKTCIANGTPLPKGHGRLIDADTLEECKEVMNTIMNECEYAVRMDEVRNTPTIIEADKEYEVEVVTRGNCMICGKELTEGLFLCKECEDKASSRKRGNMIYKLIQWFKRNACKDCDYYFPENNVCQSKKCETCGCHPYVNWFDRHFCKPYKASPTGAKFEEVKNEG